MNSDENIKTRAGRKPIIYQVEDLEREPILYLVCGETGVGKTYRNRLEIKRYLQGDPSSLYTEGDGKTTRQGRKVLVFDTNDDDYPYRTVNPDYIKGLTLVAARRIRPFNRNGTPMDENEKKEVVGKILKYYQNGLIVLDDIDHYMAGAKGQSMIGALCTIRHKGIDLLLTHQSIAKITTTEWQNCTWLRMHHQVDDITRYRERIPKYYLVRIAQLIVDEQYDLAHIAFSKSQISETEFKRRKGFFVYVDMRRQKISGCSRDSFIRACKKYMDQELGKKISMMLQERNWNNLPVYANRNEAALKIISDFLRFHEDSKC